MRFARWGQRVPLRYSWMSCRVAGRSEGTELLLVLPTIRPGYRWSSQPETPQAASVQISCWSDSPNNSHFAAHAGALYASLAEPGDGRHGGVREPAWGVYPGGLATRRI